MRTYCHSVDLKFYNMPRLEVERVLAMPRSVDSPQLGALPGPLPLILEC